MFEGEAAADGPAPRGDGNEAMTDPITDIDIAGYVDGQIDAMRRLDVEAHLARSPEVAAQVMAQLHDRDALREAYAQRPSHGPERVRLAARRLERALRWDRLAARLKRAAAIAVLVGAGWLAHGEIDEFGVPGTFAASIDPTVAADARQARETARLRSAIASQRTASAYDRAGIEAATGIALPPLPGEWTVRDVQIYPARNGTGVEVAIDAGALGDLSLFATRSRVEGRPGEVTRSQDGSAAYWTAGGSAYALSGPRDPDALAGAADRLAAAKP